MPLLVTVANILAPLQELFSCFFDGVLVEKGVPRTSQLPSRESDICRRLGKFRRETGLSRVAFARAVGIDSSALVRYEHCRAMVPYAAAYKIWKKFNVSVKWLVTGAGRMLDLSPLPDPQTVPGKPTARLSHAFDYLLTRETFRMDPFYGMSVPKETTRWLVYKALVTEVDEWLAMVPDDEIPAFVGGLEARAEELINSYGYQSAAVVWERGLEMERAEEKYSKAAASGEVASGLQDSCKKVLRRFTEFSKSQAVSLNMAWLIERLRRLTEPVGTKGKLAKALGVPQPRISEWLSGKTAPGGETTLRLLSWVIAVEDKETNPSGVVAPPGRKTQSRRSTKHESTKSSPKKK